MIGTYADVVTEWCPPLGKLTNCHASFNLPLFAYGGIYRKKFVYPAHRLGLIRNLHIFYISAFREHNVNGVAILFAIILANQVVALGSGVLWHRLVIDDTDNTVTV